MTPDPDITPSRQALWTVWVLRVVITITAVLMFDQAVFAGQFLSGVYPALAIHRDMSSVTMVFALLTVVAAVLARWPGHGARWPIVASVALLVLTALETFAGYIALVGLHIPLGVTVIMMTAALAVWAWWKR